MNKRDAKATLKTYGEAIVGFVRELGEVHREADRKSEVIRLRIGRVFADAESSGAFGVLDVRWTEWAGETYNGETREEYGLPKVSPPTMYRWKNAGTVANVLGDLVPEDCPVGSLVPPHRILAAAKTAEDRETAEEMVRTLYSDLLAKLGRTPKEDEVLSAVDEIAPPTRGKASEKKNSDDADDGDDSDDSGEQASSEKTTVELNSETLATVTGNVSSFIGKTAKDHNIDATLVRAIMAWTALSCEEFGADYVGAALSGK